MTTFDHPRAHAEGAREALRQLAHSTRQIDDPTEIYPVLGDLTNSLASLAQSLHQIAGFHDGPARNRAWVTGNERSGRAASYQVAWELHRAAEMVHQVANSIGRAHEVEATIAYDIHNLPMVAAVAAIPGRSDEPGLSL